MADAWDADAHSDALAPLLGLEVTVAQRPGVRRFLEVARVMAGTVEQAVEPDTLDLAPVFVPLPPTADDGDG